VLRAPIRPSRYQQSSLPILSLGTAPLELTMTTFLQNERTIPPKASIGENFDT
jgi:hypothetical protein